MAAKQPEAIWTGRTERGWRRDLQAAKEAIGGFVELLKTCRPLRYHAVLHVIFAGVGMWRGWSELDWLLFALVITLGLIGEAINSTFEQVGNKFTKTGQEADGKPIYVYDQDVRAIKHSAAGITTVVFLFGLVVYTCLAIWPL